MSKLDGKIALITGGSEGIGLAIAQRFIDEGAAHVIITGRRQDQLDEAVQKLGDQRIIAKQCDVSNLLDLDTLYQYIQSRVIHLDIVVANAGISPIAPLESISEQQYEDTFNVNVKGVLFTVQKALPMLVDGSSIILIGSVSAMKGHPMASIYSASKAAVRSFARCWTSDLKQRKIRVNTLSPGSIDTAMLHNLSNNSWMKATFMDDMIRSIPMHRTGTVDEVAKAAVFLASDDSSYVTGIELCVDGGRAQI